MRLARINSKHQEHNSNSNAMDVSQELHEIAKRQGLFGLGEAYAAGLFESGTLAELVEYFVARPALLAGKYNWRVLSQAIYSLLRNPQSGRGTFEVAHRHYDLGNQLFAAMLDSSMSYTCGYWNGAHNLQEAQEAKLELICKKLKLEPGMRILDIGCGWGNFAAYAARKYGVSVVGVTVSREQAVFAEELCRQLPVEIQLKDYRSVKGQFDGVVSIEMIEAVGRKNIKRFFETVSRCLSDGGTFVLQAISADTFSRRSNPALDQYLTWLQRHIFPNGYLPNLVELCSARAQGLVIENMQNLGADYEKTLLAWRHNFQSEWPNLSRHYDERFRRIWLYYLSGCAAFFRQRLVQVYQVQYSKRASRNLEFPR